MDKAKIKDYATTLAFAAVPVIIAYQAQIGAYVPVEYALLFTIAMGILSQLTADKRVKEAFADTSAGVDIAQAKVQEYQDMIANLQAEIDERQAVVDKVVGIRELTEAPVEGQ
jgi:hypothetical protein